MQQTLTIVCKLSPTPEQAQKLDRTLVAFAEACNYVNETVNPKIKNKNRIQAETYKEIRSRFGLSANLAVRVCARVAANRKVGKPVKSFKPTSADYDARIFSYRVLTNLPACQPWRAERLFQWFSVTTRSGN